MPSRLYHDIISQRGRLENLVAKLPGFKGYHEKQARREADRMLREHLTNEMDKHIRHFDRIQHKLLDGGKGLKYMPRTRQIKSAMQAYRDKVATAVPKYSAMFASIKIDEDALDRIYAFDEAQFRFILQMETALMKLDAAVAAGEAFEVLLEEVNNIASDAFEAFDLRDDEILQVGADI